MKRRKRKKPTSKSRPTRSDRRPLSVRIVEVPDDGGRRWDRALDILLEAGRRPRPNTEGTPASSAPNAKSKLERYVNVGKDVLRLATELVGQANTHFAKTDTPQTVADRVLIGLARKIESSLHALLIDAQADRAESMHHLKTLAESFIYYHVVASDPSGEKATLLLAKTFNENVRFFEANPGYAAEAEIEEWTTARDDLLRELQRRRGRPSDRKEGHRALLRELDNLADLAKGHSNGLRSWYARAYRLACEPAHMGDLVEFMPAADRRIAVGPPDTAAYRALIALDLGLHLCVDLMRTISEMNAPGIRVDTVPLHQQLERIRRALRMELAMRTGIDPGSSERK